MRRVKVGEVERVRPIVQDLLNGHGVASAALQVVPRVSNRLVRNALKGKLYKWRRAVNS